MFFPTNLKQALLGKIPKSYLLFALYWGLRLLETTPRRHMT